MYVMATANLCFGGSSGVVCMCICMLFGGFICAVKTTACPVGQAVISSSSRGGWANFFLPDKHTLQSLVSKKALTRGNMAI